jgi:hypothetical protein
VSCGIWPAAIQGQNGARRCAPTFGRSTACHSFASTGPSLVSTGPSLARWVGAAGPVTGAGAVRPHHLGKHWSVIPHRSPPGDALAEFFPPEGHPTCILPRTPRAVGPAHADTVTVTGCQAPLAQRSEQQTLKWRADSREGTLRKRWQPADQQRRQRQARQDRRNGRCSASCTYTPDPHRKAAS